MTSIFDRALSANALRKAAGKGEAAASVLLVLADGCEDELATFVKNNFLHVGRPSAGDPRDLRQMAAHMMSVFCLSEGSSPQEMLEAAKRYIASAPSLAIPIVILDAPANPSLEQMVDIAFGRAKMCLNADPLGGMPHSWVLRCVDGHVLGATTPMGDARQQDLVAEAMRRVMREAGCNAYCFVSEAWMSPDASSDRRPSEREDRIEVVNAIASDDDDGRSYKLWEIVRGETGRIVELKLFHSGVDEVAGRFANLLSDP
jgi:hypothetical protein